MQPLQLLLTHHQYASLKAGEFHADTVSVAGRVYAKRSASRKLVFYDLRGEGVKVQVLAAFEFAIRSMRYVTEPAAASTPRQPTASRRSLASTTPCTAATSSALWATPVCVLLVPALR